MKLAKILLLGAATIAVAGCDDDGDLGVVNPNQNLAFIRYIHAVNDTGALNFRVVDEPIENLPTFNNLSFRGVSTAGFQGITAGDRAVRVFPVSTNPEIAKQRLVDQTITFEAGRRYTLLHVGSARAADTDPAADRLVVIEEELPTPGAGNIAVRVLHAAPGVGPVDVYVAPVGTDPVAAPSATATVDYAQAGAYATLAALPQGQTPNALYQFAVAPAGTGTPLFTSTPDQPGIPAGNASAQAGVQIENSVLTAVVFPVPVAGSRAASGAADTVATVRLFIDRPL